MPGHYLVVLKDEVGIQAADLTARHGGTVTATWRHALRGFAVSADDREARRPAAAPAARSVSQDGLVQALDTQPNPPSPASGPRTRRSAATRRGATASWGYDAVDGAVTYALASGNSNTDACGFSPALVREAITVNASTITDARASFSNYGTCTDIFAPGQDITSSWHTGDTATSTISGTSMAAPHVTGAAALHLATHPGDSPATVQAALVDASTPNRITNPGAGSPNRLLHTRATTGGPSTVTAIRYVGGRGDHLTSVIGAPSGYVFEQSLGWLLTTRAAGTHPLYRCVIGWDNFTSSDANCEGQTRVGLLGYAYDGPVAGSHPIYRCVVRNHGDHMESYDADCEGRITEGNTGYFLD